MHFPTENILQLRITSLKSLLLVLMRRLLVVRTLDWAVQPLNVGTTAGTVAAGDDPRFGTGLTWDDIYPVGSEFSSYTDSRNPADIIGVGTWSPVVGLIAGVGAATDN